MVPTGKTLAGLGGSSNPGSSPRRSWRVVHVNSMLKGGGTDDQCLKYVAGLHAAGHRVWMAGPGGRDLHRLIVAGRYSFFETPPEGLLKLRLIWAVANLLRREQVQIVHAHHGRDYWPAIMAARLSGVRPRVVLTRHLAKSPSSWFSRHFLLSQCDALVAVSEFVSRVLRQGVFEPESPDPERRCRPPLKGDSAKIKVIYGALDTDRFQPMEAVAQRQAWNLAPQDFAFGVVGGYDRPRGKGQREFLEAAARVHAQIPQARFLIIGRGNLKETLAADIARLNLAGKAWMTPYCHDMPMAMNAIDCLVHPQVGTEALGLVVAEALACGRPVIASALDGIPEAFAMGNYGQLVQPESVDDLAGALVHWSRQPALDPSQQQALHARVAGQLGISRLIDEVVRLYGTLV
jgi:glycosyltransferase involved in cell wall biosynthesis